MGLLLLVSVPLLFSSLRMSLLDPDEGIYALIPREMLARGDWIIPHLNGIPYLEKPPFYFWLTAGAMALLGSAEWVVRLWCPLAALGTVFLTWRIGRRLYGATAGLVAGVALASCVGSVLFVRRASTDMLFTFCLTLAVYGFVRDAERPDRGRRRFLLVYLGAALAVLAKGLPGVIFPVMIVGGALLWRRRLSVGELNLGRGLALFAIVAVPWHVAAAWRAPDVFSFYIVQTHLMRFFNAHYVEDDIPISTVWFLIANFLWAFPWGVFVLGRAAPPATPAARWRPVIVLWVLAIFGLFAVSRFKHEYYALPAFPAIAMLAGAAWASARDVGRWLGVALVGSVLVGAWAIWIGGRLTSEQAMTGLAELNVYYRILRDQGVPFPFASARPFGWLLQALGVTLIVGWSLAAVFWLRGARRASFASVLGVAAVIALLILQLLRFVEPHHSLKAVAQAIVTRAGPDDLVVYEGVLDYSASLPYYTGRQVLIVNGALAYYGFASHLPESRGRFLDTHEFVHLWQGSRRVFLVSREPRGRSVATALPRTRVHEFGLYGSRWLYSNQ